jgi:hypothetical protein
MNQSGTISKLSAALAKAQSEMKPVAFDAANAFLKNKYATLGAVIGATRATLANHGLAVSQLPVSGDKSIGVETILTHESGEFISAAIFLPLGDEKGKSQAQVAGSILTYLRRYSLSGVLGIYADEDTDSEARAPIAEQPPRIVPTAQVKPAKPVVAEAKHRTAMIDRLLSAGLTAAEIQSFAINERHIMPNETAENDWPLDRCPTTAAQMATILQSVKAFSENNDNIP